jgi:hypothetical protein
VTSLARQLARSINTTVKTRERRGSSSRWLVAAMWLGGLVAVIAPLHSLAYDVGLYTAITACAGALIFRPRRDQT